MSCDRRNKGHRLPGRHPELGEQGCREGKRLRPRPLPDPQGPLGISSISSTPQWSQTLQRGEQARGEVMAGPGPSRAEYAAGSGASGDSDVDSLTVTTPPCGPQLLPV